jgi:excisionase family DNA binding protein
MTGPVLTIKEVAETMKISRSRVWELIADGTLVRGKSYGRKAVVIAESVFYALEATYHPKAPAPPVKTPRERPSAKRAPPPAQAFDVEAERASFEARRAAKRKR